MRVAVIEDCRQDADLLRDRLNDYARRRHVPVMVDVYTSFAHMGLVAGARGVLAFADDQSRNRFAGYDVVFVDVFLEAEEAAPHGMSIAKAMRACGLRCPIVFTTVSVDYAVAGYEVASGYLVKPYAASQLEATLDRVIARPDMVTIPAVRGGVSLRADSIRMLLSSGHYIDIALADGRTMRLRAAIGVVARALECNGRFYRCVRGVIVNLDHVSRLESGRFVMDNGAIVPISRRKLTQARAAFHSRGLSRLTA